MVIAKTYIFSSKYSNIYGDENLRDIFLGFVANLQIVDMHSFLTQNIIF